jgi:hypothetical protein
VNRHAAALLALALIGVSAAVAVDLPDEARFPHAKHKGLFPTCIGCHAGILEERSTERYPAVQQCAGCHDGREVARVSWDGPQREPSNLRFSHLEHNREANLGAEPALNCRSCHAQRADTAFMAVQRERASLCIACHEHRATAHLVDAECRTCHVTLAQARALPDSAIASFRKPPSHERPDFLENHGVTAQESQARCAVCHARESCARCHMNAATVPAITALEPDPRVARLVATQEGAYPVPASHLDSDFSLAHGRQARERIQSCATCHAQPSCRACHTGRGASQAIARLPQQRPGVPAGVQLRGRDPTHRPSPVPAPDRRMGANDGDGANGGASSHADTARRLARGPVPVTVHPAGFLSTHGPAAASAQLTCEGCHTRKFCSDCHGGEGERRFHPPNFVVRHAPEAYARQRDCASCHSTEVFCKDCHQASNTAASGRRDVAFHNAQPLWLLQHGQAARQGLESCASCHAQRDCMQCHSTLGWGISPHGPGFDPRRVAKRNTQMCGYCHIGGDPGAPR